MAQLYDSMSFDHPSGRPEFKPWCRGFHNMSIVAVSEKNLEVMKLQKIEICNYRPFSKAYHAEIVREGRIPVWHSPDPQRSYSMGFMAVGFIA